MVADLELRKQMLGTRACKELADAQARHGDRELARLQAQLAEAQRKGDRELVERLAAEIASNRKQAE